MSNDNIEIYETEGVVNVTYVRDSSGRGWYCDGSVKRSSELDKHACTEEGKYLYDRGFGG